jgi:hypothetical protein
VSGVHREKMENYTKRKQNTTKTISIERIGVWEIVFPLAYYFVGFLMDLHHLLC